MEEVLRITGVNILSNVVRTNEVKAENATKIEFVFNRALSASDSPVIRCHLYEPVFGMDYYLDDITVVVSPPPPPTSMYAQAAPANRYEVEVRFPEELAGATIVMNFYMKMQPLENYSQYGSATSTAINRSTEPISIAVKIKSNVSGAPKIEDVYWGVDEAIEFGKPSSPRTTPIHKNEYLLLHVHTRELWGKQVDILIKIDNFPPQNLGLLKIRNNTGVYSTKLGSIGNGRSNYTIAGIAKKENQKTSGNLSFIHTETSIIPRTIPVYSQTGRDIPMPLGSNAECRVEFRPKENYDGKFGFSWFRKGELNVAPYTTNAVNEPRPLSDGTRYNHSLTTNSPCNDQPFDEIMGWHFETQSSGARVVVQNKNDSSADFDKDTVMAENHKLDYRKMTLWGFGPDLEYLVPVMTIRKGEKAVFRLFIEAKKEVDKIEFEFNNPQAVSEGYLTITPTVITNIPIRPYSVWMQQTITVECLKEFSKELMLRAKAYRKKVPGQTEIIFPDICGAVRMLPNDISHQRNIKVVFFNVKTMLNGVNPQTGIMQNSTAEIDNLRKFLGQAYLVLQDFQQKDDIDISTETSQAYGATQHIINTKNVFNPNKLNELSDILNAKYHLRYGDIYNDWYKVFFIRDICTDNLISVTGGFSSLKYEKFTVCFGNQTIFPNKTTATHEVGHALGLPHTFDGNTSRSKYVYRDGYTDNIMDYSSLVYVDAKSFFHWQWFAINRRLP